MCRALRPGRCLPCCLAASDTRSAAVSLLTPLRGASRGACSTERVAQQMSRCGPPKDWYLSERLKNMPIPPGE